MHRDELLERIDTMIEESRERCLWFLRLDYVPRDDRMRIKLLEYIQRHGDRQTAVEAARLTRWLSQNSRDTSVAS
jgi:hypothetical protein